MMVSIPSKTQTLTSWLYRPVFPESWQKANLYALALWTNGMAFRNINFTKWGRPIIKIAEIKNGISGQTKFTDSEYEACYFVTAGDMLFAWSGQPETSIDVSWWRGPDGWLNQHIFKVQPNEDYCDRRFFYYLLKYLKPNFIGIARNKQTTGLGHVTTYDLKNISVGVPPLPEQRAIAHILGTLDDKIELNRRMNQTLEAMAQALFKSWFLDFDPFREHGMQDSPLGEIPVGWMVGNISDIAMISRKSINPNNFPTEVFDHYSIPAFDEGRMPKAEEGGQIHSNKFEIPSKAVLVSKLNPRFPRVWLPHPITAHRSVCSTEFLVCLTSEDATREYLFSLFSSNSFRETFSTLATGTSSSHQRVRPEDLLVMATVVPPKHVVTEFSDAIAPFFSKVSQNLFESRTLNGLRDSLLPKLLSGEMRVKDAEKLVEKTL